MGYIMSTKSKPNSNYLRYELWDEEISMVMSWLLHCMQLGTSQTYLFLSTIKEIWDNVSQTYSKIGIKAQLYELNYRIHGTKQGWSMIEYYNKLQSLWLDLDHYQYIKMIVAEDTTRLKKIWFKREYLNSQLVLILNQIK